MKARRGSNWVDKAQRVIATSRRWMQKRARAKWEPHGKHISLMSHQMAQRSEYGNLSYATTQRRKTRDACVSLRRNCDDQDRDWLTNLTSIEQKHAHCRMCADVFDRFCLCSFRTWVSLCDFAFDTQSRTQWTRAPWTRLAPQGRWELGGTHKGSSLILTFDLAASLA